MFNGFGAAVVNRLLRTSVKKNLYWEEKEKIFEEVYNGVHVSKGKQRCKVYGLDSNREVRARLIEILYGRVELHKDKFICPILHQEMQSMQVKKSGKVEHSDNSHDDQVFSYLMAMYVWYDGKNLMENFHLQKNTIRTDQDIEIEEDAIEDRLESHENVDLESSMYEPESDVLQTLKEVEDLKKGYRTTTMIHEETYLHDTKVKEALLNNNPAARKSYAKQCGLEESMLMTPGISNFVDLPDSIYGNGIADDEMFDDNIPNTADNYRVPLSGNLSKFWSNV